MGLKAAWYGAELFGKLVGDSKGKDNSSSSSSGEAAAQKAITWEQAKAGIRADYDQNYFVSGAADMDVYDQNCEFADPFVSFNGVDRFKQNLSNFGAVTCAPLSLRLMRFDHRLAHCRRSDIGNA